MKCGLKTELEEREFRMGIGSSFEMGVTDQKQCPALRRSVKWEGKCALGWTIAIPLLSSGQLKLCNHFVVQLSHSIVQLSHSIVQWPQ